MAGALSVSSQPTKRQLSSTQALMDTAKIQHDLSASNIKGACKEFAAILGPENVSTERTDLITHSGSDYQSYAWTEESAILSQVILYPETTEQVSELMKVCFRRRLPVTPYSGGTSIEGQYIPHLQGICIDFGRMSNIVEINKYDLDCVVQPGIGWMDLNEELAVHGLFFPPDPGPGAMIGGMVGTGCSGTNAAAYGTMKDWVLSLTVVLADGTIIKTRQRARKSSAGYDLTRTFIGSEGTLGLVTEATLKLAVKPPCEAVAVCTFPTLRDAASAVREVLSNGIQVAAVEILDEVQMKSINDSALTRLKWKEEPTLFFKFTGSDEFIVDHLAKQVGIITKQNHSTAYTFASDKTERNELWSARKNALWSMLAMRKSPTDKVWTTDVAVPLSRLPAIIEFAKADIEKSGLLGSIVGHVGDGNFHTLLLFPEEKRHIAEEVVHRMVDKAIEMKGTATGEHGVGLVKRDYLEKELGKEAVDAMRSVATPSVMIPVACAIGTGLADTALSERSPIRPNLFPELLAIQSGALPSAILSLDSWHSNPKPHPAPQFSSQLTTLASETPKADWHHPAPGTTLSSTGKIKLPPGIPPAHAWRYLVGIRNASISRSTMTRVTVSYVAGLTFNYSIGVGLTVNYLGAGNEKLVSEVDLAILAFTYAVFTIGITIAADAIVPHLWWAAKWAAVQKAGLSVKDVRRILRSDSAVSAIKSLLVGPMRARFVALFYFALRLGPAFGRMGKISRLSNAQQQLVTRDLTAWMRIEFKKVYG
ncbi:D-lactate dehydrogenase (cytochrome) [Fusarium acutatum]|uniref:D-lactate dehydrogenase (Cytochrome) n=1 Tax=Fusarium acutatum TaxID=78861 RepID=A0A8H4J8X1_9HYPO|nr:D-lactate dehydrogenase (cytochrome) [Fusarium acutatum]